MQNDIVGLTNQLDELLDRFTQLKQQNKLLLEQEKQWQLERIHFQETNQAALKKVEAVIERLKKLEQE